MSSEPHSDVVTEGRRVLTAARDAGLTIRLLGGVAVNVRSSGLPPALTREYKDLDFATAKKSAGDLQRLLREIGYEPHVGFNAMNGKERLLFYDNPNGRQVDVFVSSFRMCHEIPLEKRLPIDDDTVPLAELLLTKLQIIELNEKDARDIVQLLSCMPISPAGAGLAIDADRFAAVLGADWGWWRTVTGNLDRLPALLAERPHLAQPGMPFDPAEQSVRLRQLAETAPKGMKWKMRAGIGDKVRWYELPEEVGH